MPTRLHTSWQVCRPSGAGCDVWADSRVSSGGRRTSAPPGHLFRGGTYTVQNACGALGSGPVVQLGLSGRGHENSLRNVQSPVRPGGTPEGIVASGSRVDLMHSTPTRDPRGSEALRGPCSAHCKLQLKNNVHSYSVRKELTSPSRTFGLENSLNRAWRIRP